VSLWHAVFILCSHVTIRITVVREGENSTLRVDGPLVGDDSAELRRVYEELPGSKTVDLGGVQFVDGRAAVVLRDLRAEGATLVGASPYVRLVLGQPATEEDEP
jgi:hypothetical protein